MCRPEGGIPENNPWREPLISEHWLDQRRSCGEWLQAPAILVGGGVEERGPRLSHAARPDRVPQKDFCPGSMHEAPPVTQTLPPSKILPTRSQPVVNHPVLAQTNAAVRDVATSSRTDILLSQGRSRQAPVDSWMQFAGLEEEEEEEEVVVSSQPPKQVLDEAWLLSGLQKAIREYTPSPQLITMPSVKNIPHPSSSPIAGFALLLDVARYEAILLTGEYPDQAFSDLNKMIELSFRSISVPETPVITASEPEEDKLLLRRIRKIKAHSTKNRAYTKDSQGLYRDTVCENRVAREAAQRFQPSPMTMFRSMDVWDLVMIWQNPSVPMSQRCNNSNWTYWPPPPPFDFKTMSFDERKMWVRERRLPVNHPTFVWRHVPAVVVAPAPDINDIFDSSRVGCVVGPVVFPHGVSDLVPWHNPQKRETVPGFGGYRDVEAPGYVARQWYRQFGPIVYSTRYPGAVIRVGDVLFSQVASPDFEHLGKFMNGDMNLALVQTVIAGSFVYQLGPVTEMTVGGERFQFRKVLHLTPGRYELRAERMLPMYKSYERTIRRYVVALTRYTLLDALDELIYPEGGSLSLSNFFAAWQVVEARAGKTIVALLRSQRNDAYSAIKLNLTAGVLYSKAAPIPERYHPFHCFSQLAQSCVAADENMGRVVYETK